MGQQLRGPQGCRPCRETHADQSSLPRVRGLASEVLGPDGGSHLQVWGALCPGPELSHSLCLQPGKGPGSQRKANRAGRGGHLWDVRGLWRSRASTSECLCPVSPVSPGLMGHTWTPQPTDAPSLWPPEHGHTPPQPWRWSPCGNGSCALVDASLPDSLCSPEPRWRTTRCTFCDFGCAVSSSQTSP